MLVFDVDFYSKFESFKKAFNSQICIVLNTLLWYSFLKQAKDKSEAYNNIEKYIFCKDEVDSDLCICQKEAFKREDYPEQDGWHIFDSQSIICHYIAQETNVDVIFVVNRERLSIKIFRNDIFTQQAISSAVAIIFSFLSENPLFKKLNIYSCTQKLDATLYDVFYPLVKREEERLDIKRDKKAYMLEEFCNKADFNHCNSLSILQENVKEIRYKISRKFQEIQSLINNQKLLEEQIFTYSFIDNSEIKNKLQLFFQCRKNIEITELKTDCLTYTIHETLAFWNPDLIKKILDVEKKIARINDPEIELCLKKIFLEYKGEICVYSQFSLANNLNQLWSTRSEINYAGSIPHPHLIYYNCLGENESEIMKFLSDGKWDCAIEQSIAATKNINFGDATVTDKFFTMLRGHKYSKFIKYKNCMYSIDEFYKLATEGGID